MYKVQYAAKCNVRVLLDIDEKLNTRETKCCEFGSLCRNLHILLFLSAQRMNAKHSLGSWFYWWSTNTLYIGFVYTYSLLTTLLQYEYTGTVRVLVNFLCVCTVHKYSVIYCFYSLSVCMWCGLKDSSLLCSLRRYYAVSVGTIRQRRYYSLSILAR